MTLSSLNSKIKIKAVMLPVTLGYLFAALSLIAGIFSLIYGLMMLSRQIGSQDQQLLLNEPLIMQAKNLISQETLEVNFEQSLTQEIIESSESAEVFNTDSL